MTAARGQHEEPYFPPNPRLCDAPSPGVRMTGDRCSRAEGHEGKHAHRSAIASSYDYTWPRAES